MDIIAIDHGYSQIKTQSTCFMSSVTQSFLNSPANQNTLQFKDVCYECGTMRHAFDTDKTRTNTYYLLTLVAIAKEIAAKGSNRDTSIHLAVGLPLEQYTEEGCKTFRDYFFQEPNPVRFVFEGDEYRITIEKVSVFPQAYAAIINEWNNGTLDHKEPVYCVVDLGGWTMDTFLVVDGTPQRSSIFSHELGTISLFNDIRKSVRSVTGTRVMDAQVQHYLEGKPVTLSDKIKGVIDQECKKCISEALSNLMESKMYSPQIPLVFVGGGAKLLKNYFLDLLKTYQSNAEMIFFVEDIMANAKGYELLAKGIK